MEYLKVWVDFREIIEPLTDAEKGRLFDAMLNYAADGEEPGLSGNERFIWTVARQSIDRARAESERLRANGARGGRPKKQDEPKETKEKQPKPKRFTPPTTDEVRAYFQERGNGLDAEAFVAYYANRDWNLSNGRKMKDWKLAVTTWEKHEKKFNGRSGAKVVTAQQYEQRKYDNNDDDVLDALMAR